MSRVATLGLLATVFLAGAAVRRAPEEPPQNAAAARLYPSVSRMADGGALVSWLETTDGATTLRFARWADGTWGPTGTVASGQDWLVNWADFPTVVELPGGRLAASWLVRREGRGAYDVRLAWSEDGGASWSAPLTPHTDGTATEHGFVSLFPASGGVGAIWLDGRAYADSRDGPMALRWSTFGPGATGPSEEVVDPRICDCCQTDAAVTADGVVVVYRDRSEGEIRDTRLVRLSGTTWSEPVVVHADNWHINACPVNGPAVAADGERVAVAWFTVADGSGRVNVAFSADGGRSFGPPAQVDDGDPVGRVDLVLTPGGQALVSWLERTGERAGEVRLRRVAVDGRVGPARVAGTIDPGRASGFPRMALAGETLLMAWTEPGEPARLRFATVDASGM